jgi:choline dehydrogenase-like flavoprotein
VSRAWDRIVVGAGPVGCVVTDALVDAGLRVRLLDAGPRLEAGAKAPEVDRRAWGFTTDVADGRSFDWYRVRAIGGRSLLWGGWCYRFPKVVLARAGWRVSAASLAPHYRRIEQALGVVRGPLDRRVSRAARELEARALAKRAPLVAHRIWTATDTRSAGRARSNTIALRFEHERGVATALVCLDLTTGLEKRLRADRFVLTASPIETARILLESELGRAQGYGRGLVDHQVASYVLLERKPAKPRAGGLLAGSTLVDPGINFDASSERPYRGGFTIEVSGPVRLDELGIERMVPSDEIDGHSATMLHAIGEIFPSRGRYVDLDDDRRDAYGRRVPRIHFSWTREDERRARDMKRACIALADELASPGSRLVPFADPLNAGAGHEAGTCAGEDLVATDGRLHALSNVWVADASVMPTAGDRHPTLTLLANASRIAHAVASAAA